MLHQAPDSFFSLLFPRDDGLVRRPRELAILLPPFAYKGSRRGVLRRKARADCIRHRRARRRRGVPIRLHRCAVYPAIPMHHIITVKARRTARCVVRIKNRAVCSRASTARRRLARSSRVGTRDARDTDYTYASY